MDDPKANKGHPSINQDFGGSPPLLHQSSTARPNTNQLYGQEAMLNMAYASPPTANQAHQNAMKEQVGQASINEVYGQGGLFYGTYAPVFGQAPPAYVEKAGTGPPPPPPPAPPTQPAGSTFISLPEVIVNNESDDVFKTCDFTDASIRRGFIRKVYSLVLLQLAVTAGVVSLVGYHPGTRLFMLENVSIILPMAAITYVVTAVCIHCCEGPRRRVPYNYIFLLMFTVALSLLLGMATVNIDGSEVLIAFGITMLIVVSLTIFAFQTKYDFTMCGGFLISIILCLIILGFLAIFTHSEPLYLFYCACGIIFFSCLLVYDTQLIIGGGHRYTISPEEYVFAALCIYLDVMNIFIRILRLVR